MRIAIIGSGPVGLARAAYAAYGAGLVLIRPDGHVAWRGAAVPADALALTDTVRGA